MVGAAAVAAGALSAQVRSSQAASWDAWPGAEQDAFKAAASTDGVNISDLDLHVFVAAADPSTWTMSRVVIEGQTSLHERLVEAVERRVKPPEDERVQARGRLVDDVGVRVRVEGRIVRVVEDEARVVRVVEEVRQIWSCSVELKRTRLYAFVY